MKQNDDIYLEILEMLAPLHADKEFRIKLHDEYMCFSITKATSPYLAEKLPIRITSPTELFICIILEWEHKWMESMKIAGIQNLSFEQYVNYMKHFSGLIYIYESIFEQDFSIAIENDERFLFTQIVSYIIS